MKKAILFLSLFCMTAMYGQKRIKGSGKVVTIERTTNDYKGIAVGGFYDIALVEGEEGQLTLTGEDNILAHIKTEVKDGILVIRAKKNRTLKPSRGQGVFITVPFESLTSIKGSGSGSIVGKKKIEASGVEIGTSGSRNLELEVESNSIAVRTSGSSTIKLGGSADSMTLRSSGSSSVEAYTLSVANAIFELSGSSDVQITVNESILSKVSGSSNVRYKGNPEKIDTKASGSGRVAKK